MQWPAPLMGADTEKVLSAGLADAEIFYFLFFSFLTLFSIFLFSIFYLLYPSYIADHPESTGNTTPKNWKPRCKPVRRSLAGRKH